MNYMDKYNHWLESDTFDEETKEELRSIEGDLEEIEDRFHTDLAFGTAGLRGKLGAGTNRMNKYTVALASQGLANTIVNEGKEAMEKGVVIGFDVRLKSDEFARLAAEILTANKVKVYLFKKIRSTPLVAYAIRHLSTQSGIVVTASHNPQEYNGYKVYWDDGSQILDNVADSIIEEIDKIGDYSNVKRMDLEEAKKQGLLEYVGEEIDKAYEEKRLSEAITDDVDKDIKVIYTPLNGTGNKPVRQILKKRGFTNIIVVPEQENPDPYFTTVGYPNPEFPEAFKYSEELGRKENADMLLATDPDTDRMALVARDRDGEFYYLTGNEIGAILINYILEARKENNTLPDNAAIVKSIVTGDYGKNIAKTYGVKTYETLTGFKNICSKANEWDETKEHTFIFGYEESIGYTYGDLVRDKDGIISSMIAVEMAAYYKKRGKTLVDVLDDMAKKYGYHGENLYSVTLEGIEGSERIGRMMKEFRSNPIKEIGDMKLDRVIDYLNDDTGNPKSNVLKYYYDDGSWYGIRPSGTEPKIKIYIYSTDEDGKKAKEKVELITSAVNGKLESIK